MLNYYNFTENGRDYTLGVIKEKSCDRPPVDSPISKSAILLETFQKTIQTLPIPFPDIYNFPLTCVHVHMASRMKEILENYLVFEKSAYQWISVFEQIIGQPYIQAKYIVGSSAAYIAGQPLLHEALEIFMRHIPNQHHEKQTLRERIRNKITQTTFPFADVDLRIKLDPNYNLAALQIEINKIWGCRTELYKNRTLIVYVGEGEEKSLDIVIYTELDTESALTLDDFKVNIAQSNPEKNLVAFESINPWKWWCGLAIGFFENTATDAGRIMLRLFCQLSKGRVNILPTESTVFPLWLNTIKTKLAWNKDVIRQQFSKQQSNHDQQIPLVDYLLRLRAQQLIRDHAPTSTFEMRELANVAIEKGLPPFIQNLFQVMNTKGVDIAIVHSLIECIAYLALYEAWQKPFEVKLVKHEGKWVQRLRFRGHYKRDLLVRFDIPTSLKILKAAIPTQWEKMRVIIDSFWFAGLNQRTQGPNYKKLLALHAVPTKTIEEIKSIFLQNTGKKEIIFAEQSPLAVMQIDWSQDAKILLTVGKLVFNHYHYDLTLRHRLCWKVVTKCISFGGYYEAAEMVTMLREVHEDPIEGYASLFADAILKGGNAYLYKACSPFPPIEDQKWFDLSQSKNKTDDVVKIMNEVDVSAELFLKMVHLLKIKNYVVSESILLKILDYDKKRACEWIQRKDQFHFVSEEYNQVVCEHLLSYKGLFNPIWIKDYLLSNRFRGTEVACETLCQYLLSKPIEVRDKAAVLQVLKIKDNSLWQLVANEYISKGESWPECYNQEANLDYATLVMWHQIIENADNTAFVLETLEKIPPPQEGTRDIIRGLVLVRLLKNWEKKPVSISILKKLDLSKKPIPWEKVLQNASSAECILKALNKVSLPLYSALFRMLRPKEPFYATYWVAMVQNAFPEGKNKELLAAIDSPLMSECLHINEQIALPLFKRVAHMPEGILFILDNLIQPDLEIFCTMIQAAANFTDEGVLGARVFLKYRGPLKKSKELLSNLAILAKKLIMNPRGDTEAAACIWKTIKQQANPDHLPPHEQLNRLIELNYSDWVIELLNKANPKELETLNPDIYVRLLRSEPDLDKRCLILESCRSPSPTIQKQWEIAKQDQRKDVFAATKLLKSAQHLQIEASKVQDCAIYVLSEKNNTLDESVLKYLVDLIPKLETAKAFELWEALRKSKCVEKADLWSTGINILGRNPQTPPFQLLSWITQNSNGLSFESSDEYMTIIKQIIEFPLEERIRNMILASVKREALKYYEMPVKIYWDLDCDENISIADLELLKPNSNQLHKTLRRLFEKANKEGIKPVFSSLINTWITQRMIDKTFDSQTMQEVSRLLLIHSDLMYAEERIILLSYLIENRLHLDLIWNLITPLVCSPNGKTTNFALHAIEKLENVDDCPTRIIFHSHVFPDSIPKLETIIKRVTDSDRRDYFTGILLSATLKASPSREVAIKFTNYLSKTYRYLEANKDHEIKEWEYVKLIKNDFFEVMITNTSSLFCIFLASNIKHPNIGKLFFEPIVFTKLLEATDNITSSYTFRLILSTIIASEALKKTTLETAIQFINFIKYKILLYEPTKKPKRECITAHQDTIKKLLLIMAHLIIRYSPTDTVTINVCAEKITELLKDLSRTKEVINENFYIAFIILQGKISDFRFHFLQVGINAVCITKAIEILCEYPHAENLRKANLILKLAIPDALIMYPRMLENVNKVYITTMLKFIPPDMISKSILSLFEHLYTSKNQPDLFEMTEQQFIKFVKKKYEDSSLTSKDINTIVSQYDEYKSIRYELIYFNLSEILKKYKFSLHLVLGSLGLAIFDNFKEAYKKKPDELQKICILLKEACEKGLISNQNLFKEVCILLISYPYLSVEIWRSYFCNAQLNRLFDVLMVAKSYYEKMVSFKDDKKAILELRPEKWDHIEFFETEIPIRYQCLIHSLEIFEGAEINEDKLTWMNLIQKEILICFDITAKEQTELATIVLFVLGKLLDINQDIAFTNPTFANVWLLTFIQRFQNDLNDKNKLWYHGLIVERLQKSISLELLPCLQPLENFSMQISDFHKSRHCIEAYHHVLSLGCTDEAIIWKAVEHAHLLSYKVTIINDTFDTDAVQFILGPNEGFSDKFEMIYSIGIKEIIEKFIKSSNKKQFIEDLRRFRGYTDSSIKQNPCVSSDYIMNLFFGRLPLFSVSEISQELISEMMSYLHFLHQTIKLESIEDLQKFAGWLRQYLLMSIFYGPDSDGEITNKYLQEFYCQLIPKLASLDITLCKDENFVCFVIDCCLLLDQSPSQVQWTPRLKVITKPNERNFYISYLLKTTQLIRRFIGYRPVLQKWYEYWIMKGENEVAYVKQSAQIAEMIVNYPSANY